MKYTAGPNPGGIYINGVDLGPAFSGPGSNPQYTEVAYNVPLTVGANLNWVPATTTRLAADQTTRTSTKRQWDVFVLWTFNPEVGLRVLANNLAPRDYSTETYNDFDNPLSRLTERTQVVSGGPSFTNWQLRLELKL